MGQTVLVSHRRIIMKGLIILAVVAAASAAPSCDDRKAAVAGFKERLLTPESLAEQQAILTLAACPQAPDPAQCEQWVATYWAGIAEVLFTWLTDVKDPCGSLGLGLCKKGFTCDECLGALDFLGGVMVDDSYIAEATSYLQGPAYCGNGGEHTPDCEGTIAQAIPVAMQVLSEAIPAQGETLCQDVFGVC